ncbi:hypothetical protein SCUP234_02896 [Seiridium cupressi]
MFYSHEILNSRQYGVATIWLVATIGNKFNVKRVGKKAIQEVDVARACEKIIEPGAPIALRLQGSLLYGVSKVYEQKYNSVPISWILQKSERGKYQRKIEKSHDLDTNCALARPENLMIMDDPDFFPDGNILPDPTADMFVLSQQSNKTSSQMSPYSLQSGASSSGNEQFPIQIELRESSISEAQASHHGLKGLSSAHRPIAMGNQDDPFGEELEGPMDFGIQIDEFGNIVESAEPGPIIFDDPDFPAVPDIERPEGVAAREQPHMDEQPLPDAEALPARRDQENPDASVVGEQSERPAPAQRQRKRKMIIADKDIEISRNVMRDWQTEYLNNCATKHTHTVSTTQAKKNAIHLTFGLGIGNIGQSLDIPGMIHPLAVDFTGDSLFTAYTGLGMQEKKTRKRVRSAAEPVGDDGEERRVRPRLEEDGQQQGRGLDVDDLFQFGLQESPPEIGREAQSALDDHPSSAMPWNRGSSLMPGSSVQKGGSVQAGREQSSPLRGRGDVQDIVRYSSDADMGFIDFGIGGPQSADSSFDGMPIPELPEEAPAEEVSAEVENQYTREALDREGNNFLGYIDQTVRENGERRHDEDFEQQRKWISFDDVFVLSTTDRATAAQAFYHVLTLVTKGQMVVEQDGEGKVPFGGIHVGLKLPPGA